MPPVTKKGLKGESRGGPDPGYISGGSQGGQHSPLKGYGSPPAPHDMEHGQGAGGAGWKQEDELTNILRHQTLSDPNDPTSPMAMTFSPHGGGGGYRGPPGGAIPMDQGHMTTTAHPNGKASQQRGGGLALLAGRTPGNPQAPLPAKTFHHHPSQGPPHHHPHNTHTHPQPPPSYHQPLLYSHSRQVTHYQTHFLTPSFPSYPSGYSSLPPESRQPQPPSSVPYIQHLPLPQHQQGHHPHLQENENTHLTNHVQGANLPTPSSSGYSSGGSPKGVHHQESPSDDSSVVGGASIHSNPMTNSYSTFSSNSSRVSTPSNGNPQFLAAKTNPRGGGGEPGKNYPLQQSLRMPGRTASTDDAMSETSGRSWVYSSQSSRYSVFSTGSELSDDVLERLPTDRLRRHSFTKAPPLPLPESMQEQFHDPKMNGGGVLQGMTGMECSPPHGNGTGVLLGDTFPHPQSPVSMQLDFNSDKTMRLYHLPPESAALFTPNDAHLPYYSNSQSATDTFDFQMSYNEGGNLPTAVYGDMGSSFANPLPNDPQQQYFDSFLNSQAN